jgi:hypothetical protein
LFGLEAEQNTEGSHQAATWEFCGQVIKRFPRPREWRGQKRSPENAGSKFLVYIKVHNQIRVGDKIEILTPEYDIIKLTLKKIFDEKKQELVDSAHGGQGTIISFEVSQEVPEGSVARRKISS